MRVAVLPRVHTRNGPVAGGALFRLGPRPPPLCGTARNCPAAAAAAASLRPRLRPVSPCGSPRSLSPRLWLRLPLCEPARELRPERERLRSPSKTGSSPWRSFTVELRRSLR
mmetsp:Transcript_14376/g.37253  ORF Transcript_14376/g.37253 Transcript_14376/m.37253 type:complete len:112 (+) Transcript_14376:397-732(+)